MSEFEIRDSGSAAEYESGMRRDSQKGKPRFRLAWPKGIPFEEQLMYRVAVHYARGGEKYGDRNWEQSHTAEDLAHHEEALDRHVQKFLQDVQDGEDHAAAIVFNVNAVLLTRYKIAHAEPDKAEDRSYQERHGNEPVNDEVTREPAGPAPALYDDEGDRWALIGGLWHCRYWDKALTFNELLETFGPLYTSREADTNGPE